VKKTNVLDVQRKKDQHEKILMVTAYDYPLARLAEEAGMDLILVSDALGMVGLGYESTLPVTLDEIVHHTKAVTRGASNSLVLATLPFMSLGISVSETLRDAGRLVKEAGAGGVEVEGGPELVETVQAIDGLGIPVLAHIGLTRQHSCRYGAFRVQGKKAADAVVMLDLALSLQDAGAFAILLECVPDRVAGIMTEALHIPTIGIGAGALCDGQALVSQDMLGLYDRFLPGFVKRYLDLSTEIRLAFGQFKSDVEGGAFPAAEHSFNISDSAYEELLALTKKTHEA